MLKQLALTSSVLLATLSIRPAIKVPKAEVSKYTADGSLIVPNYHEWIFLSSGIDMSYATPKDPDHHMFNNVFVNPAAYHSFLTTGHWPEGTMLMLENRAAESPVSINKRGHTQSAEVMGNELHVFDHGKWLFYDQDAGSPTAKVIDAASATSCFSCHEAHAAVDTTFVQFYPTLYSVAKDKNTFSASYLKDEAAHAAKSSEPPSK